MVTLNPSATVSSSKTNVSSALNNINLLQPNAFKLIIDRKNFPNLEFFAQNIAHPTVDATAAELSYKRVSRVSLPADKLTFGDLTVNLILDENMNSYIEIFNWLSRLVEEEYQDKLDRSSTLPPHEADISVQILNSTNNVVRTIRYIDCVPTSLGFLDLSTQNAEGYIVLPVTFRFTYFEIT